MRKFSGNKYHFNSENLTNGPNYRKPVMKGGHTHNHWYNFIRRQTLSSKDRRKRRSIAFLTRMLAQKRKFVHTQPI